MQDEHICYNNAILIGIDKIRTHPLYLHDKEDKIISTCGGSYTIPGPIVSFLGFQSANHFESDLSSLQSELKILK